jgi:rhodanese-related sulfurtransferase
MVCRSGARSAQACMFLQQQGFSNVFNLRGGMIAWVQGGFPAYRLA